MFMCTINLLDKSTATSCNSKVTFAVVTTTVLLLIIIQVFIIAYKGQQLSHMKAMVRVRTVQKTITALK